MYGKAFVFNAEYGVASELRIYTIVVAARIQALTQVIISLLNEIFT